MLQHLKVMNLHAFLLAFACNTDPINGSSLGYKVGAFATFGRLGGARKEEKAFSLRKCDITTICTSILNEDGLKYSVWYSFYGWKLRIGRAKF